MDGVNGESMTADRFTIALAIAHRKSVALAARVGGRVPSLGMLRVDPAFAWMRCWDCGGDTLPQGCHGCCGYGTLHAREFLPLQEGA